MLTTSLRLTSDAANDELAKLLAALPAEVNLERDFPTAVLAEAETAAKAAPLPDADRTDIEFAPIDPAGSNDLDQALHLLSEGEASLLSDRLRGAFVSELALDANAMVTSSTVSRERIRTRRHLDYLGVQQQLDAGTADEALQILKDVGMARQVRERARGGASLNAPGALIGEVDGRYVVTRRAQLPVEGWFGLAICGALTAGRPVADWGRATLPAEMAHVQLPDSAVTAECSGHHETGAAFTVTLLKADVATSTMRFEPTRNVTS